MPLPPPSAHRQAIPAALWPLPLLCPLGEFLSSALFTARLAHPGLRERGSLPALTKPWSRLGQFSPAWLFTPGALAAELHLLRPRRLTEELNPASLIRHWDFKATLGIPAEHWVVCAGPPLPCGLDTVNFLSFGSVTFMMPEAIGWAGERLPERSNRFVGP